MTIDEVNRSLNEMRISSKAFWLLTHGGKPVPMPEKRFNEIVDRLLRLDWSDVDAAA